MKKEQKQTPYIYLFPIITLIIGIGLYCYWRNKGINDENGYNSINAVIALLALIVNVVTIIFVYNTFIIQRNEIRDNRSDVEFNRALDMVYRQLEYTNQRLIYIDIIVVSNMKNKNFDITLPVNFDSAVELIKSEFSIYQTIISTRLNEEDKKAFLYDLILKNIKKQFRDFIKIFDIDYLNAVNEDSFKNGLREKFINDKIIQLKRTSDFQNASVENIRIHIDTDHIKHFENNFKSYIDNISIMGNLNIILKNYNVL